MTSDSFPARVGGNNYLRSTRFRCNHDWSTTTEIPAPVSCVARELRDRSTLVLDPDVNVA